MSDPPDAELRFDWYGLVSGEECLEQGDLLDNVPIPILPGSIADISADADQEPVETEVPLFNVVVMTQSCDFLDMKASDPVTLCPRFDYPGFAVLYPKVWKSDGWGKLIRGRFTGAHLVNRCTIPGHAFDYQIVNLQQIFSLPFSVIQRIAASHGQRVRLLPPYREHLAQAFARRFMRIGLPTDLPKKFPY